MKVELQYKIILSQREAAPLKRLLGSMNDVIFAAHGVKGEDREILGELWSSILYDEDPD